MDKLIYVFVVSLAVQLGNGIPMAGSNDSVSRIIDGSPAQDSDYPYAISLQLKSQGSQSHRGHTCGGALISLRHAVTSGNCLYTDTSPFTLKSVAAYRVFAGAALLTDDASAERWRDIVQFTPYPGYAGPPSNVNDIGIITLVSEFVQSAALAPASLAAAEPTQRTWCVTAGWGDKSTSEQQASAQLQHVNRYVMHPVSCTELVRWARGPEQVPEHAMCGGHVDIFTPSCTGDGGNALVCNGAMVGVLSWYPACSTHHNVEQYTRTTSFLDWIEQVTDVEPEPPVESGESSSEESEEEDGDPDAAPPAPALAALLLGITTLAHLFYSRALL